MRKGERRLCAVVVYCLVGGIAATAWAAPAVTVYNQDFGVVREMIPLDLKAGLNEVRFADMTAHLEPDSVMLRDPAGKHPLQIVEQNYRADPVSQGLLLMLYEGKTIDFLVRRQDTEEIVKGKIIRSGYEMHHSGMSRYGRGYQRRQRAYHSSGAGQPIIEVDGKLRFGLPGIPIFPALTDETILKPTVHWKIETDRPGKFDAELSYVTGGMSWEADYNLVAPPKGDTLDLVGWVTLDNQTGKTFEDARIKLVAGDVSKLDPERNAEQLSRARSLGYVAGEMQPPVTEKTFDEYHLYTLRRRTTLRDRETKQVEFVRADNVKAKRFYVYDGVKIDSNRYRHWGLDSIRTNQEYGIECNPKVWVMREFENTKANHLGIALPKGRLRFYRRDDDGQLEFVGENVIDHTPKGEKARVYTGNAFDLVGQRIRTDYELKTSRKQVDESFEIRVRNHKTEPVDVRIVEHLYRWTTWEIVEESMSHKKLDARTIEYRVRVEPDEEGKVTYHVRYTW